MPWFEDLKLEMTNEEIHRMADMAVQLARHMFPQASEDIVEDQAFDFMFLGPERVEEAVKRLKSFVPEESEAYDRRSAWERILGDDFDGSVEAEVERASVHDSEA
jgi:hypothetical protein